MTPFRKEPDAPKIKTWEIVVLILILLACLFAGSCTSSKSAWKQCIERSDGTDSDCEECDRIHGKNKIK